ncbi:MAG: 4Fe-4S dicluster domain-containing protein [Synergistaceae bacterium]|nr:4Fe-4S dicluster domain-containing protein [Synergistaceae bacterium]
MTGLLEAVFQAGVVGEGGAGFPTWAKLRGKAECYIVNAAECEPLIETDKYLMRTFPRQIAAGAAAAAAQVGAERVVIATKAKYEREIAALKEAIRELEAKIEIVTMPSFYPAGDEQVMVYYVTGRCVPARGLPLDVGCVVDNVGTVRSVYEALLGSPVTDKYLSVTGEVGEPLMIETPIGTSFRECVALAAPSLTDYAVINGGPMMGLTLAEPERIDKAVVTKTTGNILVLPPDHYLIKRSQLKMARIRLQSRSACIQCRYCTDLCPRWLIGHEMEPHVVMRGLWCEGQIKNSEEFVRAFGDALNCCGCGICELYACPMGLSPRRVNEYFKGVLRARGLDQKPNPHPKARSSFSQRLIPTERLAARLDLLKYYPLHADRCVRYSPKEVYIPMRQGIGRAASPVAEAGARVSRGELIGRAAEGISSNVHASIDGIIKEINAQGARIVSEVEN